MMAMKQTQQQVVMTQAGFTLIELLVSMLIGLIIMVGVVQVFQGNFINARYQDNMALLQENGRFTMGMLTRQFQMAGYNGCMSKNVKARNTLNEAKTQVNFRPERGLEGWEYTDTYYTAPQSTTYPFSYLLTSNQVVDSSNGSWADGTGTLASSDINIKVVPGSDMFRIWGGAGMGANIDSVSGKGANGDADTVVTLDTVAGIKDDQILVLNNCQAADVVQACNVTGNKLILSAGCSPGNDVSLELVVQAGGNVYVLQGDLFYIGRRGDNAINPPSLFKRPLAGNSGLGAAEEVVEGIENVQLMYGVDNSGDQSADVYVTAKQITADDWEKVVSVRVTVMAGSVEDNVISNPLPIFFNGATHTPTDRRVRQVFTKTITLRNRAF
ncbi:MAG: prepilin-type N-terminal cleavage/methylation domain-containing protein [Gammaproteobacteria bacterium]|nr:MAG: prepilin-type N-terminal cleavage/methylation domain-containing protein [Gammaproteobacteria bacterium]